MLVNKLWKKMEKVEREKRDLEGRLGATPPPSPNDKNSPAFLNTRILQLSDNTCVNDSECIYCYICSLIPPTELTGPSASVAGPSAGKWALVDVAHNDTRGSAQRLSEKRIRQATARASSVSETSDHSSQDRVRALEQQLRAAEQREHDTQRHHQLQLQEKDRELATKSRICYERS